MHGTRPQLILALSVVGILGVIALAGCGDNENNPTNPGGGGGTSSTFSGMFSGANQSGKMTATINTTNLAGRSPIRRAIRAIITCSGVLDLGASNVNVSGTYDTNSNVFTMTGGGYSLTGSYKPSTHSRPSLEGFWSGPGGTGGSFICYLGNSTVVTAYCGTYHSNSGDEDSTGNWTFGVLDTLLAGYSFSDSANTFEGIFFEGKVSATGNPRIITINYNPSAYSLTASGSIDTTGVDNVTGIFSYTNSASTASGTFTGAICP